MASDRRAPAPLLRPDLTLRRYRGSYAAHAHAHAQILLGRSGRLEMELDGQAAFVDASCGLIIPPGVAHAFEANAEACVLVVDAPAQAALARVRRFAVRQGAPWIHTGAEDAADVLQAVLLAPRVHRGRRGLEVQRLADALDTALHEPWTTARMAALYCLSPQRFHARWVDCMGDCTPQQFVRQRRLDRAAAWLRQGVSLEATAARVGYASASALAYALRRDRGQAARQLRR